MQRRLALALALTALTTVVLVGLGVLLLGNRGARSQAVSDVTASAEALADLAAGTRRLNDFGRQLAGSRQGFDFEALQVVLVDDDGELVPVPGRGGRGRGDRSLLSTGAALDDLPKALEPAQQALFASGEPIVFDRPGLVIVLVQLDLEIPDLDENPDLDGIENRLGLLAAERVLALPRRTIGWFLWSSIVVLAGASLAGVWLARRLVRPIRAIQQTTSLIAGGDLEARTEVQGSDELAELANSVNVMAVELQRSKQLDQQFLMSITHDLRTPLTAIGGYAEALADGTATDGRAVGGIIGHQAQRLERLVRDLLDLARLDARQFQLRSSPMDLAVVAGRSTAEMAATAAGRDVTIRFDRPDGIVLPVHADPDRVGQVVANLVDNATKFADTTVVVGVSAVNGHGVVSVTDDGPGIGDDDLPHIFDRLYSGQAKPERAESSTGLGLTIVRELTVAMGGEVAVMGNTDKGSRFEIRLPLTAPREGS